MVIESYCLIRGHPLEPPPVNSLAISCGTWAQKPLGGGPAVHLHVAEGGPRLTASDQLEKSELKAFSQGYSLDLPKHDLTIYFGVLPWWQFPDFELPEMTRIIYVPLWGWKQGQWYDGPLAHYVAEGFLTSFVQPGAYAQLNIPLKPSMPSSEALPYLRSSFLDETLKWLSLRTSAVFALKEALAPRVGERNVLGLKHFDHRDIALLCLLRSAFPDDEFELPKSAEPGSQREAWKRLCQNIDVLYGRVPRGNGPATSIDLTALRDFLPDQTIGPLIRALNYHSPMIPHRLLDESDSDVLSPGENFASD